MSSSEFSEAHAVSLLNNISFSPLTVSSTHRKSGAKTRQIFTFFLNSLISNRSESVIIPSAQFLAETSGTGLDDLFNENDQVVNFRVLIRAGSSNDIDHLWSAFCTFTGWLRHGQYPTYPASHMHIDAYQIAEILQSPRFANATMLKILTSMPGQLIREEVDLTSVYRNIFKNFSANSPIRKLYFEAARFWDPAFSPKNRNRGNYKYMLLEVDEYEKEDAALIDALINHKVEEYKCDRAGVLDTFMPNFDFDVPKVKHRPLIIDPELCQCVMTPWKRHPSRFFYAD